MAFFERLAVLLRADAHGMVDALEDDRLLLRQHLRDAEAALASKKARLEALNAEARDLDRSAERLGQRRDALESDVHLAMEQQRDDLARFAIQQLLPIRDQLAALAELDRHLNRQITDLGAVVNEQEDQLEDLRIRVRSAVDRDSHGDDLSPHAAGGFRSAGRRITDEDVELELLRRRSGHVATGPEVPVSTGTDCEEEP